MTHSNQDLEIAQRVVIDWWNKGVDHIQFRKRSVNNILALKVAEAVASAREEGYREGVKDSLKAATDYRWTSVTDRYGMLEAICKLSTNCDNATDGK